MKTTASRLLGVLITAGVLFFGGGAARANLSDLTSTFDVLETVIFADDFDDNSAGWTNVTVVNLVGTPAPGTAEIGVDPLGSGESAWFSSDTTDGSAVSSALTLSPAPDITQAQFNVYMRVRIETDHINARFNARLAEQAVAGNFNTFEPRPQSACFLNYREVGGGQASINGVNDIIDVADGFLNFRFSFTDLGSGAMFLEGSVYNSGTTSWDLVIQSVANARYSTSGIGAGVFDALSITSRKASAAGYRAVFDAVAVTTIATCAVCSDYQALILQQLCGADLPTSYAAFNTYVNNLIATTVEGPICAQDPGGGSEANCEAYILGSVLNPMTCQILQELLNP